MQNPDPEKHIRVSGEERCVTTLITAAKETRTLRAVIKIPELVWGEECLYAWEHNFS